MRFEQDVVIPVEVQSVTLDKLSRKNVCVQWNGDEACDQ